MDVKTVINHDYVQNIQRSSSTLRNPLSSGHCPPIVGCKLYAWDVASVLNSLQCVIGINGIGYKIVSIVLGWLIYRYRIHWQYL